MLEIDMANYFQALFALVIVIALILVAANLLKRFGPLGQGGARSGKDRRLRVIESAVVDARHRLVLIAKDDHEHLLLIGAGGSLLIEAGGEAQPPGSRSAKPTAADGPRLVNVNPPATTSGQV